MMFKQVYQRQLECFLLEFDQDFILLSSLVQWPIHPLNYSLSIIFLITISTLAAPSLFPSLIFWTDIRFIDSSYMGILSGPFASGSSSCILKMICAFICSRISIYFEADSASSDLPHSNHCQSSSWMLPFRAEICARMHYMLKLDINSN